MNPQTEIFTPKVKALIVAPAVASICISILSLYRVQTAIYIPLVFFFTYLFALMPSTLVILTLFNMRFTKFWHFCLGGLFVAITSIAILALMHQTSNPSIEFYAKEFYERILLVPIGPIAGGITWLLTFTNNHTIENEK